MLSVLHVIGRMASRSDEVSDVWVLEAGDQGQLLVKAVHVILKNASVLLDDVTVVVKRVRHLPV